MASVKPLTGRIALVTGATRGLGKGIAIELGTAGATVYITGRTMKPTEGKFGSLEETAEAIRNKGGHCIPVVVNHEKEDEIESLFKLIANEQDGRLDLLVNNAYAGVQKIADTTGKNFWDCDPSVWDDINNVGLRGHYFCTVYAARMMVPRKQGLIVVVSSMGGLRHLFTVPYGVGKSACDRLAADTAIELKPHGVASISLWPGLVLTEILSQSTKSPMLRKMLERYGKTESAEFPGKILVHLMQNPDLMQYTGKIILTGDYGQTNGIVDTDGQYVANPRQISFLIANQMPAIGWLANYIPSFVKLPFWMLHLLSNKF